MPYHLLKEKINYKTIYGTGIIKYRYTVFDEDDTIVGEYFVGNTIDYYGYDDDGYGAYTNLYSIHKSTGKVYDQHKCITIGAMEGKHLRSTKRFPSETIHMCSANFDVHITNITNNTFCLLCNNEIEQIFFTIQRQNEKQPNGNQLVAIGEIQGHYNNLLLLFTSISYLEGFMVKHFK